MEVLRRIAQYLEWGCIALLTILSGARYATPEDYAEPIRALIKFLAGWAFPLVIYLAVAIIVLKAVQEFTGRRLTRTREIKYILDLIHKTYFRARPEHELYQHRVTLLKACDQRYLRVFSRSGTIHQESRTRLRIDPEHDQGNEGVGGWAWYTDAQIVRQNLPEWPQTPNPDVREDPACQLYAQMGLMSVEAATRLGIKSRSFAATVVRDRSGRKWGALVLDSRDPSGCSDAPDKMDLVRLCADLLTPNL